MTQLSEKQGHISGNESAPGRVVKARFSAADMALLERAVEKTGWSVSDVLRAGVEVLAEMDMKTQYPITEEEIDLLSAEVASLNTNIRRIGVNLNQVARSLNMKQMRAVDATQQMLRITEELEGVLEACQLPTSSRTKC